MDAYSIVNFFGAKKMQIKHTHTQTVRRYRITFRNTTPSCYHLSQHTHASSEHIEHESEYAVQTHSCIDIFAIIFSWHLCSGVNVKIFRNENIYFFLQTQHRTHTATAISDHPKCHRSSQWKAHFYRIPKHSIHFANLTMKNEI